MKSKILKKIKHFLAYTSLIIGMMGFLLPVIPGFLFLGISLKLFPTEDKIAIYLNSKISATTKIIRNLVAKK